MNTKQRSIVIFVLVISLILVGCTQGKIRGICSSRDSIYGAWALNGNWTDNPEGRLIWTFNTDNSFTIEEENNEGAGKSIGTFELSEGKGIHMSFTDKTGPLSFNQNGFTSYLIEGQNMTFFSQGQNTTLVMFKFTCVK